MFGHIVRLCELAAADVVVMWLLLPVVIVAVLVALMVVAADAAARVWVGWWWCNSGGRCDRLRPAAQVCFAFGWMGVCVCVCFEVHRRLVPSELVRLLARSLSCSRALVVSCTGADDGRLISSAFSSLGSPV